MTEAAPPIDEPRGVDWIVPLPAADPVQTGRGQWTTRDKLTVLRASGKMPLRQNPLAHREGPSTIKVPMSQASLNDLLQPAVDIEQLAAQVAHHNVAYHRDGKPEISDAQFDGLVASLRRLEPGHPVLGQVGAPVTGDKVVHERAMLSLEKCNDVSEFENWLGGIWESECGEKRATRIRIPRGDDAKVQAAIGQRRQQQEKFDQWTARSPQARLVMTPKIDGLACSIRYDSDGQLVRGATRGDGRVGEDVTRNVLQASGIPRTIPAALAKGGVEIRGEVYVPLSLFAAVADQFSNPRNLAAGLLKTELTASIPLDSLHFLAYDVVGLDLPSKADRLAFAQTLGLTPAPWQEIPGDQAMAAFSTMAMARNSWDFEADGVVFELADLQMHRRLGASDHHPRSAIAWKFTADEDQTRLVDVHWNVSRSGTITPVALFTPVLLAGASISRSSLHNLSNFKELNLHRGDTIVVSRKGGVIPHLERNLGGGTELLRVPEQCPSCGSPAIPRRLRMRPSELATEADRLVLRCSREGGCTVVIREQVLHFCSELEMDGFGEKVIDLLVSSGLVGDAADLFQLKEQQLEGLPGLGKTSAAKLIGQVQRCRNVDLPRFLTSLGIPTLGKQSAQRLAATAQLGDLRAMNAFELGALLGIVKAETEASTEGAALSMASDARTRLQALDKRLADWAKRKGLKMSALQVAMGMRAQGALIDRLLEFMTISQPVGQESLDGPLSGHIIVFTGKLERMLRRDAQKRIQSLGATAGSDVTAETTLLVVGADELEAADPSSKLKKARKLKASGGRIAIVAEAQFWADLDAQALPVLTQAI